MARIFICYRRNEGGEAVNRLLEILRPLLPPEAIFLDKLSLKAGEDFRQAIYHAIYKADACLIVITEAWGKSFLERAESSDSISNEDHVRVEVETALRLGKVCIPVVIAPATIPKPESLPATIQEILRKNVIDLDFDNDASCLQLAESVNVVLKAGLNQKFNTIAEKTGMNPAAIEHVYWAVKQCAAAVDVEAVGAQAVWQSTISLAKERHKRAWKEKMQRLGIRQSEDVGMIVYSLILNSIFEREATDLPSDFWGLGDIL